MQTEKRALRVLLVEDDAIDAKLVFMFSELFKHFRLVITHVKDIRSASEAIETQIFDVCLLDYWLNEQNSLKFLFDMDRRELRVPTIILSNIALTQVDDLRLTSGGALFLAKGSCSPKTLEAAMERAYASARRSDAHRSAITLDYDQARVA